MVERGISARRACSLLDVSRSTLGYTAKMPEKDSPVIERMKHYAALYPRFGYRRIHVYLEREGIQLGWDRIVTPCRTGPGGSRVFRQENSCEEVPVQ
jgi:putative transposase